MSRQLGPHPLELERPCRSTRPRRPFMNSRTIAQRALELRDLHRLAADVARPRESPRPMPITIRPSERSCSVAYELASTVGSRVAGFVTKWPSLIVEVSRAATREHRARLLPKDVRVVRPRVPEAVALGELDQLEPARERRIRQDGDAEVHAAPSLRPRAAAPTRSSAAGDELAPARASSGACAATRREPSSQVGASCSRW